MQDASLETHPMPLKLIFAGQLKREYILLADSSPILDRPGGSPLYAAGGAAVWEREIGLLARVGEDYPQAWLRKFADHAFDAQGIKILPESIDLRSFRAYDESLELTQSNPVGQFARRELPFPKALLGYRPAELSDEISDSIPRVTDIPSTYIEADALHLCPMDFKTQGRLLAAFKRGSTLITSLDPSPEYMNNAYLNDLPLFLDDLTVFMPSEDELRKLFWGETNDLWQMAERLGAFGCKIIVVKRGKQGQFLYETATQKRWEIPAYNARISDPTGAGDAFSGGFLAGYAETGDPLQAVAYGNISASLSMEGSGAFYPLDVLPGLAQARLSTVLEMIREV